MICANASSTRDLVLACRWRRRPRRWRFNGGFRWRRRKRGGGGVLSGGGGGGRCRSRGIVVVIGAATTTTTTSHAVKNKMTKKCGGSFLRKIRIKNASSQTKTDKKTLYTATKTQQQKHSLLTLLTCQSRKPSSLRPRRMSSGTSSARTTSIRVVRWYKQATLGCDGASGCSI